MDDFGVPVAYLVLPTGVPVVDTGGSEVGTVANVLADEDVDVFHGLIVQSADGYRFADPEQIAQLYERGVRLAVAGSQLHRPDEDPVAADSAEELERGRGLGRFRQWLDELG